MEQHPPTAIPSRLALAAVSAALWTLHAAARDFVLGGNGVTTFRSESYPLVKRLFEAFRDADAHSIRLKSTAAAHATGLPP